MHKDVAEIRRMRRQAVAGAANGKVTRGAVDDTTVKVGFKVRVSIFQGRRVFQWPAGLEEGGAQHW